MCVRYSLSDCRPHPPTHTHTHTRPALRSVVYIHKEIWDQRKFIQPKKIELMIVFSLFLCKGDLEQFTRFVETTLSHFLAGKVLQNNTSLWLERVCHSTKASRSQIHILSYPSSIGWRIQGFIDEKHTMFNQKNQTRETKTTRKSSSRVGRHRVHRVLERNLQISSCSSECSSSRWGR
jgi:hypothetical protein